MLKILKDIVKKLSENNIEYMVSGSVAMNFYSVPRMTRDIDIIISLDLDFVDKIFEIFKNDYYIDKDDIRDAVKHKSIFNIIHLKDIFKIDFIIRKKNEYRILEFNNKKQVKLDDMNIYIVSIEDLIISKIFWAKDSESQLQIGDVKNLMKNNYDLNYVKKWCKYLGTINLFERIIKK